MTTEELELKLKNAMSVNLELSNALECLLELGRKDTSNPKYDGYYQVARKAIKMFKKLNE